MTCSSQILSYRVRPMAWLSWFRRVAGFRILVSGVSVARMGVWAHGRALHMPRTRFGPRAWCGVGGGGLLGVCGSMVALSICGARGSGHGHGGGWVVGRAGFEPATNRL